MESRHLGTVLNLEHIEALRNIKPKSGKQACLHLGFGLCAVAADLQRRRWNLKKDTAMSMSLVLGAMFFETWQGNPRSIHGKLWGRKLHRLARELKNDFFETLPDFEYTPNGLHSLKRYGLAESVEYSEDWTWQGGLKLLNSLFTELETTLLIPSWGVDLSPLVPPENKGIRDGNVEASIKSRIVANIAGQLVSITPLRGEDPDLLEKLQKGDFKFLHYRRELIPVVNGREVDISEFPTEARAALLRGGGQ